MKHLDARVGDTVKEIAKGADAPEMRIAGATGDYSLLHCEIDGVEVGTFTPEQLDLIRKQSAPAAEPE
jgi:hypothetical protein